MLEILIITVLLGVIIHSVSIKNQVERGNVIYSRAPMKEVYEPDTSVVLETVLVNKSKFPVFHLQMKEFFPLSAKVMSGADLSEIKGVKAEEKDNKITSSVYIGGRQKLKRRIRVSISRRGVYSFHGSKLLIGDILGFYQKSYDVDDESEVLILPRRIELDSVINTVINKYEEVTLRRMLIEDNMSVRGFRDYRMSDPMKTISWTQTAKSRRLITKEFDSLSDKSVSIVLDVSYIFDGDMPTYSRRQEFCISAVRTLVEHFSEQGISYTFITNALTPDRKHKYQVAYDGGRKIDALLEVLARLKIVSMLSTEDILMEASKEGHLIVFICPQRQESVLRVLNDLEHSRGITLVRLFADQEARDDAA